MHDVSVLLRIYFSWRRRVAIGATCATAVPTHGANTSSRRWNRSPLLDHAAGCPGDLPFVRPSFSPLPTVARQRPAQTKPLIRSSTRAAQPTVPSSSQQRTRQQVNKHPHQAALRCPSRFFLPLLPAGRLAVVVVARRAYRAAVTGRLSHAPALAPSSTSLSASFAPVSIIHNQSSSPSAPSPSSTTPSPASPSPAERSCARSLRSSSGRFPIRYVFLPPPARIAGPVAVCLLISPRRLPSPPLSSSISPYPRASSLHAHIPLHLHLFPLFPPSSAFGLFTMSAKASLHSSCIALP
ncbi:hypothetical protein VTN02DRAFT_496 [Thermoascus thermophilus]